jgi:hypothetical protein
LVNTPDIYEENKYQRRNLLLYHCLLESGLRKFNVSEQFYPISSRGAVKQQDLKKRKKIRGLKEEGIVSGGYSGGDHKPKRRAWLQQDGAGGSRFRCNTKIPVYSQGS